MGRRSLPKRPLRAFPQALLIRSSTWGISSPFELVSPISGQVTNALLTRSPLTARRLSVRLACIRHAASVHPEPGSNSPQKKFLLLAKVSSYNFLFDTGLLVTFQLLRSCLKPTDFTTSLEVVKAFPARYFFLRVHFLARIRVQASTMTKPDAIRHRIFILLGPSSQIMLWYFFCYRSAFTRICERG